MKKAVFIILLLTLIIAGAAYLTFNETGVMKYFSVRETIDSLDTRIGEVNDRNNGLMNGIDSLKKKEPAKIERIAREDYNMSRKNEEAVKIKN
ncbi:MAG: septum formation initiator family protein [Ignavibacteriaceae bacterium]|nr:septum formation initiator family protein [Ignavibacteriaceae bacterium]